MAKRDMGRLNGVGRWCYNNQDQKTISMFKTNFDSVFKFDSISSGFFDILAREVGFTVRCPGTNVVKLFLL